MQKGADFVLLIDSEDRKGIVAGVANSIVSQDCNIVESSQFGDANTGRFFMRVAISGPEGMTTERFSEGFMPVATAFRLDWRIHKTPSPPAVPKDHGQSTTGWVTLGEACDCCSTSASSPAS